MRIAHVTDYFWPRTGGIEVQVLELARRQRARGDTVTVFTSTPGPTRVDGIDVVRLPPAAAGLPVTLAPWALLRDARRVSGAAVDVVHVHASAASPLAATCVRAAATAGLPTAVTVHSLLLWTTAAVNTAVDAATRWTRQPVAWTAVSSAAAAPLRRLGGGALRVDVLPNGIDVPAWRLTGAHEPSRRPVRLVAVGRLTSRKRPLALLRTLHAVRRLVPPSVALEAVVVGAGPRQAAVERLRRRLDLGSWVHLHGPADHAEVRDLLARSDVFVAPARYEAFGIAALEARTAGLPVVARTGTGITEFVRHGVEGLLAADDAALARAVATLSCDDALRARMTRHNRVVPPLLDWDRVLRLTDDVYGRAAALRSRRLPATAGDRRPDGRASSTAAGPATRRAG